MASKSGPAYEQAWRDAKKTCQLNARQIKMARAPGMNPKKLPRLRPKPKERWKFPVGEFLEEHYAKRFPDDLLDHRPYKPGPAPRSFRSRKRTRTLRNLSSIPCSRW